MSSAKSMFQSYYNEKYRPQFHFTAEKNWLNDPNGLVYHDGIYHMFYQYNPKGSTWGYMSWGHATSTDLVHWKHLPMALECELDSDGNVLEMFFSGSAVVDVNNTSGLAIPIGKDEKGAVILSKPMVAIYTSVYPIARTMSNSQIIREGQQAQSIAFSHDNGLTWTKYEGNPVIPSPPVEYADQYNQFRDPFVFWHTPSSRWILVASLAIKQILLIYSSDNLKNWTMESQFGPCNARFGEWECPSLFPLYVDDDTAAEKWVMLLGINPGGVIVGSGTQSFIGSFDGKTFVADQSDTYDPTKVPFGSTVFQDFESTSSTYEDLGWTATGDFSGTGPRKASTVNAGSAKGYLGNGVLTTHIDGHSGTGTIASPKFTISANYINFLVAGGYYPYNPDTAGTPEDNQVSINLVIDGKVMHSQTGTNADNLVWRSWNVAPWIGQDAHLIVIDVNAGPFAYLYIDEIVFSNSPKDEANWNDFGPDYYAAATYNGLPTSERVAIGWMNNWAYANKIPTSTWRSAMSIPRKLSLKTINNKVRIVQQPVLSVSKLYSSTLYTHEFLVFKNGDIKVDVPGPYNARMKLALEFTRGTGTKFGVILCSDTTNTHGTVIGYDFLRQNVFVNRLKSGNISFVDSEPNPFPGCFVAPMPTQRTDVIRLSIFLDWSSVEVFAGHGEIAITSQIFPLNDSAEVKLFSEDGSTKSVSMSITGIDSAWKEIKAQSLRETLDQNQK
ncbi:glycosyl hydrolase [Lipomyces kononenkoae]|uniref:Glycosyl hydrolase n=1 Tax=Lipomyces kononenkoae TaxID=34357 RepID=A0ACC3SQ32_LIPKO